jgi:acetyl esterase
VQDEKCSADDGIPLDLRVSVVPILVQEWPWQCDMGSELQAAGCHDEVHMTDAVEVPATDEIDPDIRRFAEMVTADYERLTGGRELAIEEMRDVAEKVREPWRLGGPRMDRTSEEQVPTPAGTVRIRVHDPGGVGLRPALVYMHGGGWTLFSLDTHDRIMREYAARSGCVVVGVDYALSPEARFPVALEQVIGVVCWLRSQAPALGVDPDRLALGGDSAGGNLSICAALALRDAGQRDAVKALLLIYPAVDSVCSEESLRRFGGPGAVLTGEEIDSFWRNYGGGTDLRDNPLACPVRARLEGLPPVCMTIAGCDVLAEQGRELTLRLRAAGVAVEETVYRGATHSFIEAMSIAPLAERAVADGARWLRKALGG